MFLFLQYVYYKKLIKPMFLGLKMSAVFKGVPSHLLFRRPPARQEFQTSLDTLFPFSNSNDRYFNIPSV